MRTIYIYGLFDPRSGKLRYIGKSYDPKRRLYLHIRIARKNENNTHISNWIRQLLKSDLQPYFKVLEICSEDNWQEKERSWIKSARDSGLDIVNISKGGDSPPSWNEITREQQLYTIEKRAIANKLNPPNKGRVWSQEYKERMSQSLSGSNNPLYGKHHSKETKEKIAKALRGKDISHLRSAHTIETGKKRVLSNKMAISKKNNKLDYILGLQLKYFDICGKFNLNYVLWTF